MPVEIRELNIKTQIVAAPQPALSASELHQLTRQLRQQLLRECLPVLKAEPRKNSFER